MNAGIHCGKENRKERETRQYKHRVTSTWFIVAWCQVKTAYLSNEAGLTEAMISKLCNAWRPRCEQG
jgi:hypothetical protein